MPALLDEDKSRTRYHLNYVNGTTDAGVQRWLEEAMDTLQSNFHVQRIVKILDRCDLAEDELATGGEDTTNQGYAVAAKELYDGDLQRTRVQLREKQLKERQDLYYAETDHLALKLNVPNLSRPENMERFSHMYTGGTYINAIPGPTDTCRSDKLWLKERYK